MKVKMLKDGAWCDDPREPTMHLKAGDIVDFSKRTAGLAIDARCAVNVADEAKKAEAAEAVGMCPAQLDKMKASKKTKK